MKKKMITFTMICAILLSLTGCTSTKLNIKEENVTVEYGKEVSVKPGDYLSNDKDVLSEVEVSTDIENEDGKTYPPVGEYEIIFSYEKQEAKVGIEVKDTTAPKFIDFKDTADTYLNNKVDFAVVYTAEDLSEVTITYDDSKVDYTAAGTYAATVTATDNAGNTETKEVIVNVIAAIVTLDKTTASVYTGETVQLTATSNMTDVTPVFISSDTTIATVDANGLVTGVKAGKTVITADINGVKAECEVTVSENSNASKPADTTNKKPSTNTGNTNNSSGNNSTNNNTSNNSSADKNQTTNGNPYGFTYAYAVKDTYIYFDPDTKGSIFGTLKNGQGIHITESGLRADGFYQVMFNGGRFGYVLGEHLTKPVISSLNEGATVINPNIIPVIVKEGLAIINEERVKLGREPLVWDSECEEIAYWRAKQLGELDKVTAENAHAGFDEWQIADFDNRWMFTECVAWGYGNAEGAILGGWKNSSGHWNALMRPEHTKLAIAEVDGRWVAVLSK